MKQSKLFILLDSLSKHDIRRFQKYVNSPFFNENEEILRLFEAIYHYISTNKTPLEIKKEGVWQDIFGRLPYNDTRFRRLTSELLQLLLDFLQIKNIYTNTFRKDIELLPLLSTPPLQKHFESVLRRIKRAESKRQFTNINFFYDSYLLEKYQHEFSDVFEKTGDYRHFEQSDYFLDCFYLREKLSHYITSVIYGNIRAKELNTEIPRNFLSYVKKSRYFDEPTIKVLHKMSLLFIEQKNEKHFEDILILLEEYKAKIPSDELRDMYFNAQNYCAIKINSGNVKYYKKMFIIHKALVEKGLIGENDLEPTVYKNIITIGLINDEFEWVELFIKNYTQKLPKENQTNSLTYNLAKVYFHQKQYTKVVEQLKEVEYKNHIYALGGKLMLLKTYYEMSEDRPLFSLIDSFSVYLRRNKYISQEVRQQYLNVLRFLRKLSSLAPYDKIALQKLKEKVQKSKALAAKQWLLEKIAELEK